MKKITAFLLSMMILATVLAGCGSTKDSTSNSAAGTANASTVSAVQASTVASDNAATQAAASSTEIKYPLTVKDYSGTEFTIEKKPQAIISLTLATDEMLVDMVDKSRIKALEVYADDPGVSNITEKAKEFPVKLNAELEKIIALQPDLVFVADWKEKEFVQQLRDAKIPVYIFKAPTSFDELRKAITDVAQLVGEADKGKAIVDGVDAKLKVVQDKLSTIKPENRLTVFDYTFFGSTYAKDTSFDALVEQAGLINAATKAGMQGWPNVSKEEIIKLDPDIIFLPAWSFDKKTDPQKFAENFKKDKTFASLKAVKNNRVYIMQDKHLQDNAQYMADGVEDMAKAAYPDLFK